MTHKIRIDRGVDSLISIDSLSKSELEFELYKVDSRTPMGNKVPNGAFKEVLHHDFIVDAADQLREDIICRYGPIYGPDILLQASVLASLDANYRGDMDSFIAAYIDDLTDSAYDYQEMLDIQREHLIGKFNAVTHTNNPN